MREEATMLQSWFERLARRSEGWIGLVALAGAAWVFVAMSDPGEAVAAAPAVSVATPAAQAEPDADRRP